MAQCEFKSTTCNLELGAMFLCFATAVSMGLQLCVPEDSLSSRKESHPVVKCN